MPTRVKTSTTRLPQALRERIDNSEGNSHPSWRKSQPRFSRKEARKLQRDGRKQHKAAHSIGSTKRPAEYEPELLPQRKKAKVVHSSLLEKKTEKLVGRAKNAPYNLLEPERLTQTTNKAAKQARKQSSFKVTASRTSVPRNREEAAEDEYIAYLESKLGYRKQSKGKAKSVGDGLDDLFDFANSLGSTLVTDDDFEDPESADSGWEDSDDSVEDDDDDDDVYTDNLEYEEWDGVDSTQGEPASPPPIRASDPSLPTSGKYVPPHLRNTHSTEDHPSEAQLKLTKQLKGLLNRVSEQNLSTILDSIEDAYRNHRRNDVTSTLTDLIIRGITDHSSLLDSYVVLYATLVSALHKIIGIEFAAYFLQNTVSSYETYYDTSSRQLQPQTQPPEGMNEESDIGKECQNLVVLISELYNFQVISCILVYDLIRALLDTAITELNVELLLKIVRNSGEQLRHDDPSALKDIIDVVHSKLSSQGDGLSSRAQFMIETLTNLKNNKLKRNVTQNQGGEAVERMKKFLTGLTKKRHVLAHEPLRVSLADLHSAETKGKWWLVGAAWRGDPLVEQQTKSVTTQADLTNENALMKLARKQGMNTDIRRSIFVVLMSSDDYIDACERLSQLSLTEVQQREIIRVLLHCCGNEKSYNPYYTLVGQHLSRLSHSPKITIQFCLWDFLRDLGETTVGGAEVVKHAQDDFGGTEGKKIGATRMKNIAKAYAWWISKDTVTLSILKPIDFTVLKPPARNFLRELFTQIFVCSQTASPLLTDTPKDVVTSRNRGSLEEIFMKGSRIEALAMGIIYFLSEAFRKQPHDDMDPGLAKMILWAVGIAQETLRTGVDVVLDLDH